VPLLVALAKHLDAKTVSSLPMHLCASLSSQSELVQCAVGAAMPAVLGCSGMDAGQARHVVSHLLTRVRPVPARLSLHPPDGVLLAYAAGRGPRHCARAGWRAVLRWPPGTGGVGGAADVTGARSGRASGAHCRPDLARPPCRLSSQTRARQSLRARLPCSPSSCCAAARGRRWGRTWFT